MKKSMKTDYKTQGKNNEIKNKIMLPIIGKKTFIKMMKVKQIRQQKI